MKSEILLFPYDAARGDSLYHRLIAELQSETWTRFRVAVAFSRVSGNVTGLLDAIVKFAAAGGMVSLTFGADTFGTESGTDLQAIGVLVERLKSSPTAEIHLYHEKGRTFHPKIYLFDNEAVEKALVVVGSSNWSYGGLAGNVEADLVLHLDLDNTEERAVFDRLDFAFKTYWTE